MSCIAASCHVITRETQHLVERMAFWKKNGFKKKKKSHACISDGYLLPFHLLPGMFLAPDDVLWEKSGGKKYGGNFMGPCGRCKAWKHTAYSGS